MQSSADPSAAPQAPASGVSAGVALLEDAKSLWDSVRGLTHDHLKLAALETKLAGQGLVTMIVASVIVAVLLVSAWLGLVGAGVLMLIGSGVIASVAMLAAVGINLVVAFILYNVIRRKSRHLLFPATLRSLRPVAAGRRDMPMPDDMKAPG